MWPLQLRTRHVGTLRLRLRGRDTLLSLQLAGPGLDLESSLGGGPFGQSVLHPTR